MKILQLIYTNGVSGAEKYLSHLLPALREFGIECHLIIVCSPSSADSLTDYCNEMNMAGVPASLTISSKRNFFKVSRNIARYIRKNDIHYIHSHLFNSDVLATMVKIFFDRKVILISTKHGYRESILEKTWNIKSPRALKRTSQREIYYYIARYIVRHADYNYGVSKSISKYYTALGLTKTDMPYIHHGVTIKEPENKEEVNEYRFSGRQLIIVGRLEEVKGHRYLLEAMPSILAKFPECKLLIIGEGSQKAGLQQLSTELGITDSIIFKGFSSDPYTYISNSDVIILPFFFESFGLVYIEAFALKVPVVAFDTPAGNEIMQHGDTALLVKARDSAGIAKQVIYLLENPDEAKQMAFRAYRDYQENFSTERMVKETAAFYKGIEKKHTA